jgi:nucleoside-diphosphate kinase
MDRLGNPEYPHGTNVRPHPSVALLALTVNPTDSFFIEKYNWPPFSLSDTDFVCKYFTSEPIEAIFDNLKERGLLDYVLVPPAKERTYIMIKPDGVQRGLIGDIIKRFETKGFKLVAMKLAQPGKGHFEKHYADLSKKPFFNGLVEYAASGPVCCMVWEGDNAVLTGRKMLGATKPFDSEPGTIRGDYCIDVGRNICHGSDSVKSANDEINLWFTKEEVLSWDNHSHNWVYE